MMEGNIPVQERTLSTSISEVQQVEVSPEERWDLLQRVVNSQELKRAVRLRDLLLYLGKRSLKDHVASIREQEIGAAVFGRPEDYDTNIDNIVRVNVSELRKRLFHYFQEEGLSEAILLEIPRGGYLPVFLARQVTSMDSADAKQPPAGAETTEKNENRSVTDPAVGAEMHASRTGSPVVWALSIALVVAFAAAAFLFWQERGLRVQLQPWQADATSMAFWSQFFGAGQQVDIVTADTSYALAEDILQRPISLDDYLDYKYKNFANLPGLTAETRDALNLVLDRNTGSVGDFEAAERIMELNAHSPALKLASARAYTADNIKHNNVILIGSRESNPWVELYKERMNFTVEYDPAKHRSYVVNRTPAPGEQEIYEVFDDRNRDYSVVTFIPNVSEHRYTLIIAGTDSQGTEAAGEFITSSEGLAALREHLPLDSNPYFEVLLSSSRVEGTVLRTSIQAFRGYKR